MPYRRKRAKYIWLPSRYAAYDGVNVNATPTTAHHGRIEVNKDGAVNLQIAAVLLDSTIEATDVESIDPTNVTIADIVQSNEYFIKRICGSFIAALTNNTAGPPAALLCMGLFVSRVDSSNHLQPAGATAGAFGNFDPMHPDTLREPWIFRRTWLLGNQAIATDDGIEGYSSYSWMPPGNVYSGDNRTTQASIDQKTARRVRSDERLFLAVSARAWPIFGVGAYSTDLHIDFTYEFRALGQLRRPTSRGVF